MLAEGESWAAPYLRLANQVHSVPSEFNSWLAQAVADMMGKLGRQQEGMLCILKPSEQPEPYSGGWEYCEAPGFAPRVINASKFRSLLEDAKQGTLACRKHARGLVPGAQACFPGSERTAFTAHLPGRQPAAHAVRAHLPSPL